MRVPDPLLDLRRCEGHDGHGCDHDTDDGLAPLASHYSGELDRWACEACIATSDTTEPYAVVEHPAIPWLRLLTSVRREARA